MLYGRPLDTINAADIHALRDNRVLEGDRLDYKEELVLDDDGKRKLCQLIIALAAKGGDILVGVREAKDPDSGNLSYPAELVGAPMENLDALRLQLDTMLRDRIQPRITGVKYRCVDGFPRGPILIVRIPQSWNGPHGLYPQKTFFGRSHAGVYPLDQGEIRAQFLRVATMRERARNFRNDRLSFLAAESDSLWTTDQPKLIVHAQPLGFDDLALDLHAICDAPLLQPLGSQTGHRTTFNIDGVLCCALAEGSATHKTAYTQVFRDGSLEAAAVLHVAGRHRAVFGLWIEQHIVTVLQNHLAMLRAQALEAPLAILVTLVGAKGMMLCTDRANTTPEALDRDPLFLPDVLLEPPGDEVALEHQLKPMFDALWQAAGQRRSPGYTDRGDWDAERHRR